MRSRLTPPALLILTLAGSVYALAGDAQPGLEVGPEVGPELGRPAAPEEIAATSIGVFPDGSGLPEGGGTVTRGAELYQGLCLSCHGAYGLGASAESLAGAETKLTDEWPEKNIGTYWPYATTLFDFIRRSMPMTAPGSLSDDDVYAVTAYLLYLNDIIAEDAALDREALTRIEMPNRDGFIKVYENRTAPE